IDIARSDPTRLLTTEKISVNIDKKEGLLKNI
ncbi:unnamed protein product, partial [marine sediment metagenome]